MGKNFLANLKQTGFGYVKTVTDTGINSSSVTKGFLSRDVKPGG